MAKTDVPERSGERSDGFREKLDQLLESRKATENTLSDCRMRWERMRKGEIKFAAPENVEELLDGCDDDFTPIGLTSHAMERTLMDNGDCKGAQDDHEEEQSLCSVLNIIWMELIGLVVTVYAFIKTSKRKE